MRVAIVHEWLEQYAGSERVLAQLLRCYPDADVFAVVDFLPAEERGFLDGRKVTTSFIQKLPLARKRFRNYLQLMPIAVEQFDLSVYDLVISSHHAVAKGVITGPDQVHVSYVHSPMRYAWDLQAQYLRESGLDHGVKSLYVRWLLHQIRSWDVRAANGVDVFVANSRYIARRIKKVYRREAVVVAPPVALQNFVLGQGPRDGFLVASRFTPYKRVELIVEAFRRMPQHHLTVLGAGANAALVARTAQNAPNITLRPPAQPDELIARMQSARAMVFAAEEDFGITTVEAQACGTPVIAFGRGGARDIIIDRARSQTGILFKAQTPEAIIDALGRFEAVESQLSPAACRQNALRFSEEEFCQAMRHVVDTAMDRQKKGAAF
jgi:glycosyltransferase involved in cell wall biosynthesis